MNKQEKIQKALDALPKATGGDWEPDGRIGICRTGQGYVRFAYPIMQAMREKIVGHEEIAANLALASASKELAEEVLRLRGLVPAVYKFGRASGVLDQLLKGKAE